jgi:hypothetical protein
MFLIQNTIQVLLDFEHEIVTSAIFIQLNDFFFLHTALSRLI